MLFFLTVKTESRDLSTLGGLYHQAISIVLFSFSSAGQNTISLDWSFLSKEAKLVLFIIPGIWQVFNT